MKGQARTRPRAPWQHYPRRCNHLVAGRSCPAQHRQPPHMDWNSPRLVAVIPGAHQAIVCCPRRSRRTPAVQAWDGPPKAQMRRFEWGGTCSDARPRLGRTLQAVLADQEGDHRIPGSAGASQDASRAYCAVGSAPFSWNPCALGLLSRALGFRRLFPRRANPSL